jgi:hypothetical protein
VPGAIGIFTLPVHTPAAEKVGESDNGEQDWSRPS